MVLSFVLVPDNLLCAVEEEILFTNEKLPIFLFLREHLLTVCVRALVGWLILKLESHDSVPDIYLIGIRQKNFRAMKKIFCGG